MRRRILALMFVVLGIGCESANAAEPRQARDSDRVDVVLMLVSTAAALMLTPALGLFNGGLVRRKNVLATIQPSLMLLAVVSLAWVLIGYSIAFGGDVGWGLTGGIEFAGWRGVGLLGSDRAPSIPHELVAMFELALAVLAPTMVVGALAERVRPAACLSFGLIWSIVVYAPVAHWLRGGGWLARLGAMDDAGGLVVHTLAGAAALAAAMAVGGRRGYGVDERPPHNLVLTTIGTALLWAGGWSIAVGGALGATGPASLGFVNTMLSAAAGAGAWSLVEWLHKGKATVLGTCTGLLAGLVAVSAAARSVAPLSAIALGLLGAPLGYAAIARKARFQYDDALDVVAVHGVCGAFGAVSAAMFATAALTKLSGRETGGLIDGDPTLLGIQLLATSAVIAYGFVMTYVIMRMIDRVIGLRVDAEAEEAGLDLSQHGERGYIMDTGPYLGIRAGEIED
jgi:ammonium transporter, Amt family